MAILGHGGVGAAIVNGILKAVATDADDSVEGMFRDVTKELVDGLSMIRHDEASALTCAATIHSEWQGMRLSSVESRV